MRKSMLRILGKQKQTHRDQAVRGYCVFSFQCIQFHPAVTSRMLRCKKWQFVPGQRSVWQCEWTNTERSMARVGLFSVCEFETPACMVLQCHVMYGLLNLPCKTEGGRRPCFEASIQFEGFTPHPLCAYANLFHRKGLNVFCSFYTWVFPASSLSPSSLLNLQLATEEAGYKG